MCILYFLLFELIGLGYHFCRCLILSLWMKNFPDVINVFLIEILFLKTKFHQLRMRLLFRHERRSVSPCVPIAEVCSRMQCVDAINGLLWSRQYTIYVAIYPFNSQFQCISLSIFLVYLHTELGCQYFHVNCTDNNVSLLFNIRNCPCSASLVANKTEITVTIFETLR